MRALLQRVRLAYVSSNGEELGRIGPGLVVLLGVAREDGEEDAIWLAERVPKLRLFRGPGGEFDRSLTEVGGGALVVSQVTLYAECARGRRPSFAEAAGPREGERLYRLFVQHLGLAGVSVATGRFGADMVVTLENDGPVTVLLDSRERPVRAATRCQHGSR
ncbi:MAG: D-tyrosyl-tRNA(Tyr) deacylase [Clostridia bacterium]|nr:D-tyrosyl-tRNA(Tyr) deacylase [Clostridia bacterium]